MTASGKAIVIYDTLHNLQFTAEIFSDHAILLRGRALSAMARNLFSELHSGFINLLNQCVMDIGPDVSREGELIWCDRTEVRCDVKSIEECLGRFNRKIKVSIPSRNGFWRS